MGEKPIHCEEVVEKMTIGQETDLRVGIDVHIPELLMIGCTPHVHDWIDVTHFMSSGNTTYLCSGCGARKDEKGNITR